MKTLRYTLVADGTSDRCLVYIINWLLLQRQDVAQIGFVPQIARPVPGSLADRARQAVREFPCDILMLHRDAENQDWQFRIDEIRAATAREGIPPHVAIVPVRMTEAWLLLEDHAIRMAADNPNGRAILQLPRTNSLQNLPDPKQVLWNLLMQASEKTGRRLEQFKRDLYERRQRVAELIQDFSPLRDLSAFASFEVELQTAIQAWIDQPD